MQAAKDWSFPCVLYMVLSCLSFVLQLSWIERIEAQIDREKEAAYLVTRDTHPGAKGQEESWQSKPQVCEGTISVV